MDLNKLYQLIDIDSPEEFIYYENYAELLENTFDIPEDLILELFSSVPTNVLADLTYGYFEELLNTIPDDQIELYTLIDSIGKTLIGLAESSHDESREKYTKEFHRFRQWFFFDSLVDCTNSITHEKTQGSINQALILYRLSKLGEASYTYDFSNVLDYELDEYILHITPEILADYEDDDEEIFQDTYEHWKHTHHHD